MWMPIGVTRMTRKAMPWNVYMLRCGDGTLYTGITTDVAARVAKHADGTGAKYTRGRGPFDIVLKETYPTKSEALMRECAIKALSRVKKLALVAQA